MRAALVAFVIVLMTAMPARAGAWLYPQGAGQVIVTTTFADARNAYDASGRLIRTPSYRKFETRAYIEHGVADGVTFVGEAGYMDFRGAAISSDYLQTLIGEAKAGLPLTPQQPSGPHYSGFGVGAAGLRVRLLEYGPYVVSLEASLRAASAPARRYLDMRDAAQADARVLVGRATEILGVPGFIDAQFGYRSRGQNGDEARVDLTYGLRPLPQILLLAQSFTALTPRGGRAGLVASQKFQVGGVYDLTANISVQIGAVAALGGVNSPAERGLISAVWLRY